MNVVMNEVCHPRKMSPIIEVVHEIEDKYGTDTREWPADDSTDMKRLRRTVDKVHKSYLKREAERRKKLEEKRRQENRKVKQFVPGIKPGMENVLDMIEAGYGPKYIHDTTLVSYNKVIYWIDYLKENGPKCDYQEKVARKMFKEGYTVGEIKDERHQHPSVTLRAVHDEIIEKISELLAKGKTDIEIRKEIGVSFGTAKRLIAEARDGSD